MNAPLLSVRGLSVGFRTRDGLVEAVRGVSFDLAAGEVLGLVGESGSGKSATAHALLGLPDHAARVTAGAALFGGRDLLAPGQGAGAPHGRALSIVFQNARAALNPIRPVGLQIADVIARHDPAAAPALRARVLRALRRVRIADPGWCAAAYPHQLSGGMCQRVGIAIALAGAPRLLIADEPSTGLDTTTQAAVMALLRGAARRRGAGCLLITHDLALAATYCDRIVVLRHGAVVEDAPAATIFARPAHPHTRRLLRATPAAAAGIDDLAPDEPPLPPPRAPGTATAPPVLELRGLGRHYRLSRPWRPSDLWRRGAAATFRAVDGVDLLIRPGEAVGLVGESGCGKSTLARMVNRLIPVDAGELLLDGVPIHHIPPGRFATLPQRRAVQLVFQDAADSLNPRFTAFDAIADPARQLLPREGRAALRARVERAAAQVGLPPALLARRPHQLSGGQQARVGLARAMVVAPRLLVLDEPTGSLDTAAQAVVLRLLMTLRRRDGVAQLLVSHDLNVVRLLCDRIAVMHRGRVVESGTVDQVLRRPAHDHTRALLAALPRRPAGGGEGQGNEDLSSDV